MSKNDLKRFLPTPEKVFQNKGMRIFAPYLRDARLWHFNRHCLTKAVYIGVICAFFPLPGQMAIAALLCLYFHANVPMAIGLTWLTNPLTTIPVFYASYRVGAMCLDVPVISLKLIGEMLSAVSLWLLSDGVSPFITYQKSFSLSAFLLGLFITSLICSIICAIIFKVAWRYKVINSWKRRNGYRSPQLLKKYRKKAEREARKNNQ